MPNSPELFIPEGLVCADPVAVVAKLGRFATSGADDLHLVFDFDRTLTVSKADTNEDITTWHIMQKHLPPEGQASYQHFFDVYRPMEREGRMRLDEAIAWWSQILDLFVHHKVDMGEVENDFLSKVTIRPGTEELFTLTESLNIPTVILSAGIKDIIKMWAKAYGIHPSVILSTGLILDEGSRVTGWDESTLVHTLNKKEMGHAELSRLRTIRPLAVLIGDAVSDADMVDGQESVLRVLVHNPRPDEDPDIHPLQQFDLMSTTGDFRPLTQLLEQIVKKPGIN